MLILNIIIMKSTTKKHLKNLLYGFLAWLIPFVSAFLFYTKDGGLRIDIFFFKTIMILVGLISVAFLLVSYFKKIKNNFIKEGIIVGVVWFVLNLILDLLVLIPMSGMSISDYLTQIGLRYLTMPTMSIAIGVTLANKNKKIL